MSSYTRIGTSKFGTPIYEFKGSDGETTRRATTNPERYVDYTKSKGKSSIKPPKEKGGPVTEFENVSINTTGLDITSKAYVDKVNKELKGKVLTGEELARKEFEVNKRLYDLGQSRAKITEQFANLYDNPVKQKDIVTKAGFNYKLVETPVNNVSSVKPNNNNNNINNSGGVKGGVIDVAPKKSSDFIAGVKSGFLFRKDNYDLKTLPSSYIAGKTAGIIAGVGGLSSSAIEYAGSKTISVASKFPKVTNFVKNVFNKPIIQDLGKVGAGVYVGKETIDFGVGVATGDTRKASESVLGLARFGVSTQALNKVLGGGLKTSEDNIFIKGNVKGASINNPLGSNVLTAKGSINGVSYNEVTVNVKGGSTSYINFGDQRIKINELGDVNQIKVFNNKGNLVKETFKPVVNTKPDLNIIKSESFIEGSTFEGVSSKFFNEKNILSNVDNNFLKSNIINKNVKVTDTFVSSRFTTKGFVDVDNTFLTTKNIVEVPKVSYGSKPSSVKTDSLIIKNNNFVKIDEPKIFSSSETFSSFKGNFETNPVGLNNEVNIKRTFGGFLKNKKGGLILDKNNIVLETPNFNYDTKIINPTKSSLLINDLSRKPIVFGGVNIFSSSNNNPTVENPLKLDNKTNTENSNSVKSNIKVLAGSSYNVKFDSSLKEKVVVDPIITPLSKTKVSSKNDVTNVQIRDLITDDVIKSETIFKPSFKTDVSIKPRGDQTPFNPTFFNFKKFGSDNNIFSKASTGFDVLVRKRGVFSKVNTGSLTRSDAINFGAFKVGTSASASFKIVPSGSFVSSSFNKKANLSDFNIKNDVFIEKKEKRIKSFGELQEITFKGVASNKNKSRNNIWGL